MFSALRTVVFLVTFGAVMIGCLMGCADRAVTLSIMVDWVANDPNIPGYAYVELSYGEGFLNKFPDMKRSSFVDTFDGEKHVVTKAVDPPQAPGGKEKFLFEVAHRGQMTPCRQIQLRIRTTIPCIINVQNLPSNCTTVDTFRGIRFGPSFQLRPGDYHIVVQQGD